MTDAPDTSKGQPTTGAAALFGCCPRCGARTLFSGLASFAPRCTACGLDFSRFNVGDGPAAFLTLGVGGLVTILALWLELALEPAWWVHVILWLPLTTALVLGGLRVSKAALLIREYRADAREVINSDFRQD
ncbi:DUF983 domain-containing protein [Alteraurantiacibacter buctensis]|uniref:DUF983 domain-containing protein n=1 Tax=Alteraurantiacibacter buctensis TaxID=1503981 RepID=A0A844YXS9_9SPHN|nr:DUF983 domain-containing protein [Alteraurantiacibacter buctensis]